MCSSNGAELPFNYDHFWRFINVIFRFHPFDSSQLEFMQLIFKYFN